MQVPTRTDRPSKRHRWEPSRALDRPLSSPGEFREYLRRRRTRIVFAHPKRATRIPREGERPSDRVKRFVPSRARHRARHAVVVGRRSAAAVAVPIIRRCPHGTEGTPRPPEQIDWRANGVIFRYTVDGDRARPRPSKECAASDGQIHCSGRADRNRVYYTPVCRFLSFRFARDAGRSNETRDRGRVRRRSACSAHKRSRSTFTPGRRSVIRTVR